MAGAFLRSGMQIIAALLKAAVMWSLYYVVPQMIRSLPQKENQWTAYFIDKVLPRGEKMSAELNSVPSDVGFFFVLTFASHLIMNKC